VSEPTPDAPEEPPRTKVYVGLRVYDPKKQTMVGCKGLSIILERWSPEDVHKKIVDLFRREAEKEQRRVVGAERVAEEVEQCRI